MGEKTDFDCFAPQPKLLTFQNSNFYLFCRPSKHRCRAQVSRSTVYGSVVEMSKNGQNASGMVLFASQDAVSIMCPYDMSILYSLMELVHYLGLPGLR